RGAGAQAGADGHGGPDCQSDRVSSRARAARGTGRKRRRPDCESEAYAGSESGRSKSDGVIDAAMMDHFPEFMRHPANRIANKNQGTRGIEGYIFDGSRAPD